MDGYVQKQFEGRTKRYVQTLDLRNDPNLIREYRKWHSEAHHWREIREGIRAVGILEMEIYLLGTRLVMAEWESFVAKFQGCDAHATSSEKWQMMERIFHLYTE